MLQGGDVKGVLKFFVGADNETDALIDEAMEVGAASFVTATQLTVARTLLRNPDKYAQAMDQTDGGTQFKREGTMKALKCMLEKQCCSSASSASTSTSVTPSRRALLAELSSSDDSSSSEDNSIQVTKAVQSHVAHISSNEEEPSEDRVHETSEAELQHISSEDEEESKIAMEMPIQRHPPEKTKKRNLSEMQNIQVEAENTTKKAKKSKRNKSPPKPEQSPIKKKHKHKSKK